MEKCLFILGAILIKKNSDLTNDRKEVFVIIISENKYCPEMIQIFVFYKLKSELRTVLSVSGGATLLKYHINASNPSKFPQLKNC